MTGFNEDRRCGLETAMEERSLNASELASMDRENAHYHVAEVEEWIARYGVAAVLHTVSSACLRLAVRYSAYENPDEESATDIGLAATTIKVIADGFDAQFAKPIESRHSGH